MPTVGEIVDHLDQFAPPQHAAAWDNVGLLLGERSANVDRILTCLTVTPPVVEEAIALAANLIVTHHPMLFRPIQKITDATPEGRMLLALLRHGIAVHSPHTAFDNCAGGINDMLAQALELCDARPLRSGPAPRSFKIAVFVPETDLARVSDAMFAAGAGRIGEYRECSFRLAGTGTFHGSEAANPAVGAKGRREEVAEWRLEVVCPESALDVVVAALRQAHSYEEPAFDVYPLQTAGTGTGAGRIGTLQTAAPLDELAGRIRETLRCGPVQVVGDGAKLIQRVAVACGAAGEFLIDAARAHADAFVTGEMRFHDLLAAQANDIAVTMPGHYATERFAIELLAEMLGRRFSRASVSFSCAEADPVHWV